MNLAIGEELKSNYYVYKDLLKEGKKNTADSK